jgi:hypothetical protein
VEPKSSDGVVIVMVTSCRVLADACSVDIGGVILDVPTRAPGGVPTRD